MSSFKSSYLPLAAIVATGLSLFTSTVKADVAEAADRAFAMAAKYGAMGYYISPSKEGHGGFGVTYEFEVPVSKGLDYVFIAAGDKNCDDLSVYIESEESENTLVKDVRHRHNALAGARWRSDYNGVVNVVVHFAKVQDRCGYCAVVGRRGTVNATLDGTAGTTTAPGATQKADIAPKPGAVDAVH